jgi:mono/diheme cytochrome c family protein
MFTSNNDRKMNSIRKPVLLCSLSILVLAIFISACGSNQPANTATSAPVSFANDVAPIFNNRCIQCHSGAQASGQLDLSSYAAIMAGGRNGAVISPGNISQSSLISLIQSGQMPRSGAKLTSDQIKILEDWVTAGAQDN